MALPEDLLSIHESRIDGGQRTLAVCACGDRNAFRPARAPSVELCPELYRHGPNCEFDWICRTRVGKEVAESHRYACSLSVQAIASHVNSSCIDTLDQKHHTDKILGVLLETFLGGMVEIVLFMVLLHKNNADNLLIPVIRAAILGSILANLLLCLGFCFFIGGLRRTEQEFDEVISEVGSGLLLMAGFGLLIPSAFFNSLNGSFPEAILKEKVLNISRITAIILLVAFFM